LEFRHIALEGPIGVGKSPLAEQLCARLDATAVLDETENPFLGDFYIGRQGAAFQTQLFSLLARHRQQVALRQSDLFHQLTICDYLFDKDKIYAYLNLDDNELFIYQRLFDLLASDVPQGRLSAGANRRPPATSASASAARARPDLARRGVSPRAERGLQPLLLPLQRDAAAGRRNLAVRSRLG
jgi:hypothetical protein